MRLIIRAYIIYTRSLLFMRIRLRRAAAAAEARAPGRSTALGSGVGARVTARVTRTRGPPLVRILRAAERERAQQGCEHPRARGGRRSPRRCSKQRHERAPTPAAVALDGRARAPRRRGYGTRFGPAARARPTHARSWRGRWRGRGGSVGRYRIGAGRALGRPACAHVPPRHARARADVQGVVRW